MPTPAALPIYARPGVPDRLSWTGRLLALAVAVAALSVLVTAARVTPSPTGMGTHHKLGFAKCGFLAKTGLPCPSCGMTTSFAHFVRGNVVASAYVQPMGMALAVLAGVAGWSGVYIAATGRPAHRVLRAVPGLAVVVPLLALGIAAWAWKIAIHLRGADGWG